MCSVTFRHDLNFIQRFLVDMIANLLINALCIVVTAIAYFRAVFNVKKLAEVHFKKINSGIHKLLWYPTVLFAVFIPSLLDRLVAIINPMHTPPLAFLIPHAAVTHSIGFINVIVYGLQKRTPEYKRSETIVSLDGGVKQIAMMKVSNTKVSTYQGNTVSPLNSGLL